MKINHIPPTFSPVIITLETKEEFDAMYEITRAYNSDSNQTAFKFSVELFDHLESIENEE